MKLRKYTEQQLRNAVETSRSIRETLSKLGIAEAGGNYQTINKAFDHFEIDTSHFRGQGWLKGGNHTFRLRPIEEVLVEGKFESSHGLKNRLIKEGLKDRVCVCCGLTEWLGNNIPLELHHKDGNRKNNTLDNLELRCPNCHTLTDNYRRAKKSLQGLI